MTDTSIVKTPDVSVGVPTSSLETGSTGSVHPLAGKAAKPKRGLQFWLVILAICVSVFLSALEYVGRVINPPFSTRPAVGITETHTP